MRVHLINPSDLSFGTAVVTPRWLFVLAAATPAGYGDPVIVDETLDPFDPPTIEPGDVVGIGIHTGNALRGYEVGRSPARGARYVVYGGIHATLFPDECHERGGAHAVVRGDGDLIWASVLADCVGGRTRSASTRAVGWRATRSCRRAGICCRRALHVGIGSDRPRLSEALLVLLGVADRRPEAAAARRGCGRCRRSSSCGSGDSASSCSPTTTSIRSRSADLAMAARKSDADSSRS